MKKIFLLLLIIFGLAACASGGNEPTVDDIGNRLNSEYGGVSLGVFVSRNGAVQSQVEDAASHTVIYTWKTGEEGDDDYCSLSLRVDADKKIINRITIINSGENSYDTFWFFHHKYVEACKFVK